MHVDEEIEGKKTIIQFYALFIAGLVMQVLPISTFHNIGIILIIVVAIAAYCVRRSQTDKSNYSASHCTNLIVTFWMSQLILTLSFIIGIWLLISNTDMSAFSNCHASIPLKNDISGSDLVNAYLPCINVYKDGNMFFIILTAGIILLPSMLYFIYRLGIGMLRARRSETLAYAKNWIML